MLPASKRRPPLSAKAKRRVAGLRKSTSASLKVSGHEMQIKYKLEFSLHYVAIEIYDKDWKKVTEYVGTRISAQVRSHA
jgi:hypothetical protein